MQRTMHLVWHGKSMLFEAISRIIAVLPLCLVVVLNLIQLVELSGFKSCATAVPKVEFNS